MDGRIGKRLFDLRKKAGLTQEELARKAELTKEAVYLLEKDRRVPSWPTVMALASALGVDCTAFVKK